MKIIFTGKDDFSYNRTRILRSGLDQIADTEVIEYPIANKRTFNIDEFKRLADTADIIYIPPLRHSDVRFIKKLTKTPVLFDPLISKYLTRTIDHGKWWTAPEKFLRDRIAFNHSDYIIMDTSQHRAYVINKYKLDPDQVFTLPVGVDTTLFKPENSENSDGKFIIGFYGGFIPLQGTEKIVKTAKLLEDHEDINFKLIGEGSQYASTRKLARKLQVKNVEFLGWVDYDELAQNLNSFDLCLGIFGSSLKTDLVIPNKIYHYTALKKCIITKDTPAIREIFDPEKHLVTTSNNAEDIADKILSLKNNKEKRLTIADNGFNLVTREYNHIKIAEKFVQIVKKVLG